MADQYINTGLSTRGGARFRVKLDGKFYHIELTWSELESAWSLSLYDASKNLLRAGLVCRHGEDVFEPFTAASMPGGGVGKLIVWDTTRRQLDPGRSDLKRGAGVRLVYRPAADVLAGGA